MKNYVDYSNLVKVSRLFVVAVILLIFTSVGLTNTYMSKLDLMAHVNAAQEQIDELEAAQQVLREANARLTAQIAKESEFEVNYLSSGESDLDSEVPLAYEDFDKYSALKYFQSIHSMWGEQQNFDLLDNLCRESNLDPLFMIAITGQEQDLVRTYVKDYAKMSKNPFNVYGSWQEYNTTLEDASQLAINLVVKRRDSYKSGERDLYEYINAEYAEHSAWSEGVSWFHNEFVQDFR